MMNASLKWQAADWLNVVGRVNLDNSDYRNKNEKSASTLTTFCGVSGGFEDAMRQERSLYADFLANIDKTFGDFHLTANVGASIYHTSMDQLYIAGDLVILTSSRSTILISPPTINRTLPDMKMKFKVFLPVLN